MNPSQASAEQFASSSRNNPPLHLDALIDQAGPAASFDVAAAAPALMSKDEWVKAFKGAFQGAHEFTGLQSLRVDDKEDRANACAGALYETISEIPALHILLSPKNKWWGRGLAIGMFVVPVGASLGREIRQSRAAAAAPAPGAAAAPGPDLSQVNNA